VERLRENVALVNLLGENGMTTMQQLYEKVAAMNKDYYALRGEIVSTERRIAVLSEHLSMWEQYQEHRAVCKKYTKVKPGKRELFTERHQAELAPLWCSRKVSGKTEIRRRRGYPESVEGGAFCTGG